jgi:hypothetical protein
LLTAVLGNVCLARAELPADSPAQATLAEAVSTTKRTAELAHQMLLYSGHGPVHAKLLDCAGLVHELRRLLATAVPKKASFVLELDHAPVQGDPTQHRGGLSVTSELRAGTRVRVLLPLGTGAESEPTASRNASGLSALVLDMTMPGPSRSTSTPSFAA